MKKYLISIGYYHFTVDRAETALALLEQARAVDSKYISPASETIYVPTTDKFEIKLIDESLIREATKEEKENEELEEAKNQARWAKEESARLNKTVEELRCQIKILTKADAEGTL